MAAYPSYPQLVNTVLRRDSGVVLDIMDSGIIRGSMPYDKSVVEIEVNHFLTAAELSSLRSFAEQNAGTVVTFTYDGDAQAITYDVLIQSIEDRWHASGKYFVDVTMVGNPQ